MAQAFENEDVQEVLPSKKDDGDDNHSHVEVGNVDECEDHAHVRGWLVGALGALGECLISIYSIYSTY